MPACSVLCNNVSSGFDNIYLTLKGSGVRRSLYFKKNRFFFLLIPQRFLRFFLLTKEIMRTESPERGGDNHNQNKPKKTKSPLFENFLPPPFHHHILQKVFWRELVFFSLLPQFVTNKLINPPVCLPHKREFF